MRCAGYPQLILLDEDNELITTEGCGVIMNDPKGWASRIIYTPNT